MNDAERQLVNRYVEGVLSPSEMQAFSDLLAENASLRAEFLELLNLDSALHAVFADSEPEISGEPKTVVQPRPARRPALGFVFLITTAVCLAFSFTLGWWWQTTPQVHASVRSATGVHELTQVSSLTGEWHRITTGAVDIETPHGGRLVIEAPAAFRFETAQKLHLQSGRLAADIPPQASGFTVITPTGEAVDLGTRFGVDVLPDQRTEVHVFKGQVVAKGSDSQAEQHLEHGEAWMLNKAGGRRELRSAAFIQPDEVHSLHAALKAGQQSRSLRALSNLKNDLSLIALLDFETSSLPPGNYHTVQGRWPGSVAPEFVKEEDHMRLDVGEDRLWPQLTLAAWVRLDQLGAPYQSLLHTDDWSKYPGQVHWMVTRHMTMRLALFGNTLAANALEKDGYPDSQTKLGNSRDRWVHLATVYDSQRKSVRFYLNGRFDNETRQEIAHPARLGPAQIGNWNRQDRKLSGRIDELILLGRAFSDEEIAALYAAGNPYR